MLNALSIDVEEYFQVSNFEKVVQEKDWRTYESRVERSTREIISLLREESIKATFFVLGWVAEQHPHLIREIAEEGHEVACHGYGHKLIYQHSRDDFREDIRKSKGLLEDVSGSSVIGYRAPSYSITGDSLWALDILIEEGFKYDSSIFPIKHDRYGIYGFHRFPHVVKRKGSGTIKEFPLATVKVAGMNVPVAGGGYFRLFPYWFTRWGLHTINSREKEPFIFYFHPWEIDPEQPRICTHLSARFRHCVNLSKTKGRLKKLMEEFKFSTVRAVLGFEDARAAAGGA